jgi:hypothetical protein
MDAAGLSNLPDTHAAAAAGAAGAGADHTQGVTGSDRSSSSDSGVTSNQRQQQQDSPAGPVARTAADAVLLLHRLCGAGYRAPQVLVHHLLDFVGPRLHELTLLQVGSLVSGF